MKFKFLIIIFLTLFLIYMYKINNKSIYIASKVSKEVNKIDIRLNNHKILIFYPSTEYELLNTKINNKIEHIINDFKNNINNVKEQLNQFYTLNVNYEKYSYKHFKSYVFHIDTYTGGAHPNHTIWTITYDTSLNKIIDINTLIQIKPNILNIFSKISRNKLLYNEKIIDTNMMLEGITPKIENFSNFAFSKNGIILFFEYYQVAPYSSGEFNIIIPYESINLLE